MRVLPSGPPKRLPRRLWDRIYLFLRPPRTADEYLAAAVIAEREGREGDSLRLAAAGLRRHPDDYYLLMKRLTQERARGDRTTAEELIERASRCCPATAATFTGVAEEYAYLGLMDTSVHYFRKALERMPSNSAVREKLALALLQKGETAGGLHEMRAAVEGEPENMHRRELLAQALFQLGQFDAVVEELSGREGLAWDGLMCLSLAKARLAGADSTVEALIGAGAAEQNPK